MKKYIKYIFILAVMMGLFIPIKQPRAEDPAPYPYKLLAPLPCEQGTPGCVFEDGVWKLKTFDPQAEGDEDMLGNYLNLMIKIIIGLAAVMAMVMIVLGGIEYMTSELISSKEAGKEKIIGALLGLLIILGAYTILNTINPDLLKTNFSSLTDATIEVNLGGEGSSPFVAIDQSRLQALGIQCPKSGGQAALDTISRSFINNVTYNQEKRSTTDGSTIYLDCSSYVAQVYNCAGLQSPGGYTKTIFTGTDLMLAHENNINADGTTVNGIPLRVGDLLGWRPGQSGPDGHVVMYIGNGQVIDASSSARGVTIKPLNSFRDRIKYVKKI